MIYSLGEAVYLYLAHYPNSNEEEFKARFPDDSVPDLLPVSASSARASV